jgi:cyclophilin family peptidyl-prolyl cis-trans isomerase
MFMPANRKAEVEAAQKSFDFKTTEYQIELDTSLGKIRLNLLPDVAPGHCKNMLGLAKIGYYDGGTFHRIIKDFMIQGGCPEGTGTGGPGYKIAAEFNATPHEPGVLSMARTGDPNSAGSQFFICLARVPHLDRQYTAFGRTADADSLAVVLKIGEVATDSGDRPRKPVTINKATVIEKSKAKAGK